MKVDKKGRHTQSAGKYTLPIHFGILRKVLIAVLIIVPLIVLIGWIINNELLRNLGFVNKPPMNPLTAIFFIGIGGVGVFFQSHRNISKLSLAWRIILLLLSLALIVVSILIELREILNLPFYPDALLFSDQSHQHLTSLNAALCFTFSGVILAAFILVKPIRFGVVQISAVAILALSVAAIIGYTLNQPAFYSLGIFSPISFWSALLFAIVGGSILQMNFGDTEINRWVLTIITTVLTVILCAASLVIYNFDSQQHIRSKLQAIDSVTINVNRSLSAVLAAESSMRGYLITGDETHLHSSLYAIEEPGGTLDKLAKEASTPIETAYIQTFRQLIEEENTELKEVVVAAKVGGLKNGINAMIESQNELLIDNIRSAASQILTLNNTAKDALLAAQSSNDGKALIYIRIAVYSITTLLVGVLMLLMRETTIRIKTEKALKKERNEALEGKAKDETILKSIGDGVFVLDPHSHIILFNQAAEKISGLNAHEVLGKNCHDVLHFAVENQQSGKIDFIDNAQCGHFSSMKEHTLLRTRTGEYVPVADSTAPIIDANGNQLGAIVVFRDITRQRQLETAKDEFISLASHQLRTPLTSMRLFLEMLLNNQLGKLNDGQRNYLQMIETSTLRMIRLVGDMLSISRIELGRLTIEPIPTDVTKLIQNNLQEMAPLTNKNNLKLIFTPDKHMGQCMVDPLLFDQVIRNLLSNAIRYTPLKGTITIRCHSDKNGLQLSIADTGIGIPKKDQAHIFERFYRAGNATNSVSGTGLGLYLVKLILDSSGGSISFISQEGKGTTFTVKLPPGGMHTPRNDRANERKEGGKENITS